MGNKHLCNVASFRTVVERFMKEGGQMELLDT